MIEEEPRAGGVEQQIEMEGLQFGEGRDRLKMEGICTLRCFESL